MMRPEQKRTVLETITELCDNVDGGDDVIIGILHTAIKTKMIYESEAVSIASIMGVVL